ncbi:hypothetical protein NHX12_002160, partial [Muraenolepis orangiensis]
QWVEGVRSKGLQPPVTSQPGGTRGPSASCDVTARWNQRALSLLPGEPEGPQPPVTSQPGGTRGPSASCDVTARGTRCPQPPVTSQPGGTRGPSASSVRETTINDPRSLPTETQYVWAARRGGTRRFV